MIPLQFPSWPSLDLKIFGAIILPSLVITELWKTICVIKLLKGEIFRNSTFIRILESFLERKKDRKGERILENVQSTDT